MPFIRDYVSSLNLVLKHKLGGKELSRLSLWLQVFILGTYLVALILSTNPALDIYVIKQLRCVLTTCFIKINKNLIFI